MVPPKKDVYSKRLLDSIPAPLEDDSDSDFKSGPYIPTPAKPKKRTRKSSSSTLPQKRRKATKTIESDEEEEFIPNVHERKAVASTSKKRNLMSHNPLQKYFEELLVIFEDDEEDEQELDEESSDHSKYSDESKTSDPIGFLNLSARSLKKELERHNGTDSVTESESCEEGSSIQTSQANQSVRISAPIHKQTNAEGYEPDSVTESESDAEAASQVPPKAKKASHNLSAVARGKRPQVSTQESDSVTESESESESEPQPISKPKALSRRPGFVLQPGQQLASYYLDEKKTAKIPSTLNPFLREYQREGVQFLYRQYAAGKGGLLGDDMGLVSKTIQTISFLSAIMKKTGFSTDKHRRKQYVSQLQDNKDWRKHMPKADEKWPTCIIIAPSSVTGNWEQEFRKWGYFEVGLYMGPKRADVLKDFKLGRLDVLVTSFEIASRDIEELYDLAFTCIIIDEAHRLKDKNTQLSTSCSRFLTPLRYGLTGTAIQNNYNEFWALLDWTNPGEVGTLKQWKHYVTTPLVKAQSATATEDEQVIGSAVAAVLRDKLLPEFFLRRTKDIIKDQLPTKTDQVVFCPLTRMQARAYKNILSTPAVQNLIKRDEPCSCGSRNSRKNCHYPFVAADVFRFMSILIKMSNHLALILPMPNDSKETTEACREIARMAFPSDDGSIPTYSLTAMRTETCGKWAVLDTLLNEWRKDKTNKVLVFTKSVKLLNIVEDYLKAKLRYTYLKLDGSTKQELRMGLVDKFNKDPDIFLFLISTAAGGTGLNLTGANKVVVFDPNWNPALDLQAMDRAFRIGQLRDVTVYRLLAAGSVEELIYARQIYKQQQMAIGYNASIQTRYFEGVQGDNAKKGELFGLENIFKLHEGAVATKHLIEKAHIAELDWALANMEKQTGKKMKSSNELAHVNEEDAVFLKEDKKDSLKGLGSLLFDDSVPQPKKGSNTIDETIKQIGVRYIHHNDKILEPSHVQAMQLKISIENLKKKRREAKAAKAAAAASGSKYGKRKGKQKDEGTSKEKEKPKPAAVWPPPNRGKNRKKTTVPVPSQLEMRREALVDSGAINCEADIYDFAQKFVAMCPEEQLEVLRLVDQAAEEVAKKREAGSSSD